MSKRKLITIVLSTCSVLAAQAVESSDSLRAAQIVAEKTATEVAEKAVTDAVKAAAEKAAKEQVEAAVKEAVEKAAKDAVAKSDAKADAEAEKTERKEEMRRIETRVFHLVHASAVEVAENLNTMWSGDFGTTWKITKMAVAFPESNAILVTAPRFILDACEKAVAELDVEAQQVYIEARFVELGNTASHKVGIDWSMLDGMTGSVTLGGGLQEYRIGAGVDNYHRAITAKTGTDTYDLKGSSGGDASITYFNGTLNFSEMALTLRALDATQDTKTFSNPKIIVSSGKKATVDMTQKYPNVKVSAKRTEASGSTSLDLASELVAIPGEDKFMFAKEAFFSWGISLEVTPRVSTNGLINVSIVPTISSQEDWVVTGTTSEDDGTISSKYPVIKVQRLISDFDLESGTTAVIGGLSITEEQQVDNGIPLLRDIPWIGTHIFGSMQRVKVQKEIIVFVTVGLVSPHHVSSDVGLPKNAVLGRQYTKGQKLEPGDRPEKNMEGIESLDMRSLEEQAKDPLRTQKSEGFLFEDYIPFRKE